MAVTLDERLGGKLLAVQLTDKLSKDDYQQFIPEVEKQIRTHGKIRILVEMTDFEGWDGGALWEDIKFDARHYDDVEKVAVVGDRKWQDWMTAVCKPFTTAEVRYFNPDEAGEARRWVEKP